MKSIKMKMKETKQRMKIWNNLIKNNNKQLNKEKKLNKIQLNEK